MAFSVIAACWVWMGWAAGRLRDFAAIRFVARFVAISALLFFVWVYASAWYVKGLDRLLALLFSLFDVRIVFDYRHAIYYETFNVVVCVALVLSFPFAISKRRWGVLAVWAAAIVAGHAAGRVFNVLYTAFQVWQAQPLSIAVNVIGQYVVPVVLWFQLRGWQARDRKGLIDQAGTVSRALKRGKRKGRGKARSGG
jgi:hypothetical protein